MYGLYIAEDIIWSLYRHYYFPLLIYTNKSKKEFTEKLNKIKPFIGQPLEFELKLKKQLYFKNKKFNGMDPFNKMHQQFSNAYQTLTDIGNYPHIIKPL